MQVVQQSSQPIIATEWVWYSGTQALSAGQVIVMDKAEGLTPSAGEFSELRRGTVYKDPETADFGFPTRVVRSPPVNTPGPVQVIIPKLSHAFHISATGATDIVIGDFLILVTAKWHVAKSGEVKTAQDPSLIVCQALEGYTDVGPVNILATGLIG